MFNAFVVALWLTFVTSVVYAQPVLTFDHALLLALDRLGQLVAQDYAATSAREMAVASAQLPDPDVDRRHQQSADQRPRPLQPDSRLHDDAFDRRAAAVHAQRQALARAARFDREAEAAQAGRTFALANLQRDTALAWLDRYYQERIRYALTAQRDEARLQVEAADAAYRCGRGSHPDVFSARMKVAQIEDRIVQADRQVATASNRLARCVGDAANQPLCAAPNTDVFSVDWASLEDHISHHPQLELLLRQEQVARAEVEIAQTNKRSDWSAELMYSQRGPAYSNMISVNFSIPWQLDRFNRQYRELAAKLAVIDQLQAQREEATR